MGAAAGRKRRWGSSTAVTAKKPSISITTDSLKVLTDSDQDRVSEQDWEKWRGKSNLIISKSEKDLELPKISETVVWLVLSKSSLILAA